MTAAGHLGRQQRLRGDGDRDHRVHQQWRRPVHVHPGEHASGQPGTVTPSGATDATCRSWLCCRSLAAAAAGRRLRQRIRPGCMRGVAGPAAELDAVPVLGDPTSPVGPVFVSLSDTATSADSLVVTASTALADTGTGVDDLQVQTASNPSLPDTATGTDSLSVSVAAPLADTAAAATRWWLGTAPAPIVTSRVRRCVDVHGSVGGVVPNTWHPGCGGWPDLV